MKITTKIGDDGKSCLFNGKRILKSDLSFQLMGDIDELNAFIGLLKVNFLSEEKLLENIQTALYKIMAYISAEKKVINADFCINTDDLKKIDNKIIEAQENVKNLDKFIIPGGSQISALSHICRTIARRVERSFVDYSSDNANDKLIKQYLNRLSDFFFVIAYENL